MRRKRTPETAWPEVVRLRDTEGRTWEYIARRYDVSTTAVKTAYSKERKNAPIICRDGPACRFQRLHVGRSTATVSALPYVVSPSPLAVGLILSGFQCGNIGQFA
jgi:hypothetical protein